MKKAYTPNINSSKGKDLTKYVSKFIYDTKFKNIPNNVVELAKKHILDGFGLALSGSVARTGNYLFKQIKKNSAKHEKVDGSFLPGVIHPRLSRTVGKLNKIHDLWTIDSSDLNKLIGKEFKHWNDE